MGASARQFGWFLLCVAVLTAGAVAVVGTPGACACAQAECQHQDTCEHNNCESGYNACEQNASGDPAKLNECVFFDEACRQACKRTAGGQ